MKFEVHNRKIREVLHGGRIYQIPRFQRDYSWGKREYGVFLSDMFSQLSFENGQLCSTDYYLGSALFRGQSEERQVEVVDGQQRLTTITVLLAAIRDAFARLGQNGDKLAETKAHAIQDQFIFQLDADGEPHRILKTRTSYPYFTQAIQERKEPIIEAGPSSEEERLIKEAYDYYADSLSEAHIWRLAQAHIPGFGFRRGCEVPYIDLLVALRDQILGSDIICIFAPNSVQANAMFENLNSKGIPLTPVDLVKNAIFSVLAAGNADYDEPADRWLQFKRDITDADAGFDDFFYDYWRVAHPEKALTSKNLYTRFVDVFPKPNEDEMKGLLQDIENKVRTYVDIVKPDANKYKRQQDKGEEECLRYLAERGFRQVRVPLLALYASPSFCDGKMRREFVRYLGAFHFAAFGLQSGLRANKLTTPFRYFAQEIKGASSKSDVKVAIAQLEGGLSAMLEKEAFVTGFQLLEFGKKYSDDAANRDASFALYQIDNHLNRRDYRVNTCTIEHIVDEFSEIPGCRKLGNLTVLEGRLNNELQEATNGADPATHFSLKYDTYRKSSNEMTKQLVSTHDRVARFFTEEIDTRTIQLAHMFWDIFFVPKE